MRTRISLLAIGVLLCGVAAQAADWGLKQGTPMFKSISSLAMGPDGILFVGDAKEATVYAIDTGDKKGDAAKAKYDIPALNEKIAAALGSGGSKIVIDDLIVNPQSGKLFVGVTQTTGSGVEPVLVSVDPSGKIERVAIKDVPMASVKLPNPPEDKQGPRGNRRLESITDLAYIDSKVLVSGLTAESAPSTVRQIAFPFAASDVGTNIEIFHGAHGKVENYAPVRTFVPFTINGEPNVLAGFTCTPLVRFPLSGIEKEKGKTLRGTTVAELGNRNKPLDMIVYEKDGKRFLLMANSARGVMKIATDNIERKDGITEPVKGGGTAGQSYDTITSLKGVVQLDKLNSSHAVVLVQNGGKDDLKTIELP